MDEIELGLHAEAQRKLIEKLKDVCLEMYTQIICTTHSKEIFDCLPNDARFYVESVKGKTKVTQGISSEFAFTKLSAITGLELDIYVEDEISKSILLTALPAGVRARTTFRVIGSATALARQLAALYVRGENKAVLAIFDGDQKAKENNNLNLARKMAEKVNSDFEEWFKNHTAYLPGETWPEAWLLQKATEALDSLAEFLGADAEQVAEYIEYGLQAGKHNEFHEVAKQLGLEQPQCLQIFTLAIANNFADEFSSIINRINAILDENS